MGVFSSPDEEDVCREHEQTDRSHSLYKRDLNKTISIKKAAMTAMLKAKSRFLKSKLMSPNKIDRAAGVKAIRRIVRTNAISMSHIFTKKF